LLGVKLFDSGIKVVSMYGSPDSIEAVNVGSMGSGGAGGAAGGRGGSMRGGPGGGSMGPAGPGGRGAPPAFSFGDFLLRQSTPGITGPAGAAPADEGPSGGGGGGGAPARGGAGMPPNMGGRGGSGGGQATENATYTRWIYNRAGSKYGFVVDKSGHVVQIEAIGLKNTKVKTSKGVTFGDSFATVIKKYQTPDGYDISGDNILARFLNKNRVAFRFARLGENKPQVVTGIVVAAGKG